ncbi:MAG: hypothetical protein KME45_05125 [Stenomitos rutilans HA7619-LM2]|jgi:uncharacterized protein (DUF697 family)|nr:hypothetical protein [Stenomitos rutilans HA7619-LM2]
MATQDNNGADAFAKRAERTSQALVDTLNKATTAAGEVFGTSLHDFLAQGTETVGKVVTPIVSNPFIKFATKVPGVSWLMAALGQVDVDAVQRDVAVLRRDYPLDDDAALAQRVIADTAWKAAGIGLATNFIPPLALMLFAVDFGAIAALQAEMIYRVAAIYGFSPTDPTRRGEVLTLWGVSTGSSEAVKVGLSVVELVPVVGAAVGSVGNAAILYALGNVACRFYEAKRRAVVAEGGK